MLVKKPARGNLAGEEQHAQRLEPGSKAKVNDAVAKSVANPVIGYAWISEHDEGSLRRFLNAGIFNGSVNTLEVGMIEHVLECGVKFQTGAFIQLDVFEQGNIRDV